MKLNRNYYKTLLMLCMAFFLFTSCDDDDDGPADPVVNQNLVEVAQSSTDLETLVQALTAADLAGTFTGTDEFTIFAPSNEAFAGLPAGTLDNLLLPENQDQLIEILSYHVVAGKRLSTSLSNTELNTLLTGETITIAVGNDGVTVEDANVTTPDLEATNGVIHIIDEVLIPPVPTIATRITRDGADTGDDGLSILLGILTSPGYENILATAGDESATLTVFAPTNKAFNDLLASLDLTLAELTPEIVEDIINFHILPQTVLAADLMAQDYPSLLEGEGVTVTLDPIAIEGASVVDADVEVSNGVIHIVDQVLLPSVPAAVAGTVVGVAYFNREFTSLVAALQEADLVGTLLMEGPYTVFAPDNAAFDALYTTLEVDGPDEIDDDLLESVLQYHVLGGEVLAEGLSDGGNETTLNTADVYFSINDNGAFINGNTITGTDLDASNGVVHTINQVLLPPPGDLVQAAIAGGYSKLAEALTEAGLVDDLQGDGPFTVFAPTDAAFDALYAALEVSGPAEIDDALLEDVLLYHVLNGRTFSSDLSDGLQAPTLSDATDPSQITINIGESVTISDNNETSADATVVPDRLNQIGTNGVIHEIDAVLLPN